MVRGCQKKMVYLKNTGSEVFSEAYFVVSDKALGNGECESDMVKEATRILNECISFDISEGRFKRIFRKIRKMIIPFCVGLIIGTIATIIIK